MVRMAMKPELLAVCFSTFGPFSPLPLLRVNVDGGAVIVDGDLGLGGHRSLLLQWSSDVVNADVVALHEVAKEVVGVAATASSAQWQVSKSVPAPYGHLRS
jgi:hypothetical protein